MKPPQRALLVEDDRSWQQILFELLTDAGLEVDLAVNYDEAVSWVSHYPHRLAVVDLSLVSADHLNQDGFKVLDWVRQHDPTCVTVLLSGYATVEIAVSALTELGVFTCLRKELFQRSEFQELIRRALAAPGFEEPAPHSHDWTEPDDGTSTGSGQKDHPAAIVVDDDAGWRSILTELLSDSGFQVRACQGFGEALGCLRRETYQLAVVDLSLDRADLARPSEHDPHQPDWEGYRLLAGIRAAGIPAVVVSGVANPGEIEHIYREQGIFSFIEKQSFDREVFITTVAEARKAAFQAALQAQQAGSPLHELTARELEVLKMIAHGATNKEIAEALFITPNTVKRHLKSIFQKLEVHTRSAAAAMAASWFGGGGGEEKKG